jgi:hypothetical protein
MILGLIAFAGLLVAIYFAGRWILGPIDRAAKARKVPARITLADILCLFLVVQLPMTLASSFRVEETEAYFWIFMILAWVIAPVIWISCAMTLSRAGISSGKARLLFMGLVLPIVYYGLTPFAVTTLIGVTWLMLGEGGERFRTPWIVAAWAFTAAALVGCGIYTNRLARQLEDSAPVATLESAPS